MKHTITFLLLLIYSTQSFSQDVENYNLSNGVAIKGYDVVSYFSNKAEKGNSIHSYEYKGVKFHFTTKKNLYIFKEDPEKYMPQYGGYCAYAIAQNGDKVGVNPKTFEIRDDKLYLFYNRMFTNTLKSWLSNNPKELQKKGDKNWAKIIE